MRNNHAQICANDAMVQCPLTYDKEGGEGCSFYTTLDGGKKDILSRLKKHLRQVHSEKDYQAWKEAQNG